MNASRLSEDRRVNVSRDETRVSRLHHWPYPKGQGPASPNFGPPTGRPYGIDLERPSLSVGIVDTPHPKGAASHHPQLFGIPILTPVRFDLQRPNSAR